MKKLLPLLASAFTASAFAGTDFAWSTDKVGYTGEVTRYSTEADAIAGTNAVGTYNVAQRDLGTYIVNNRPDFDVNQSFFLTAWYYTTDPSHGAYSGWGNPSNTDNSFVQLADTGNASVSSISGGWASSAYNAFFVTVTGANANYAGQFARFWNAGQPDVGGKGTAGTFLKYTYSMEATGLNGAVDGSFITATNHPAHVTGTFDALFHNESTDTTISQDYYVIHLKMNDINWAFDNQAQLNGAFSPSYFSAQAVPEPTTMAVLALGAVAALKRRRK